MVVAVNKSIPSLILVNRALMWVLLAVIELAMIATRLLPMAI